MHNFYNLIEASSRASAFAHSERHDIAIKPGNGWAGNAICDFVDRANFAEMSKQKRLRTALLLLLEPFVCTSLNM